MRTTRQENNKAENATAGFSPDRQNRSVEGGREERKWRFNSYSVYSWTKMKRNRIEGKSSTQACKPSHNQDPER